VEQLIDRENELSILRRLARKKIGPRLLGTFKNGRFEQYFYAQTLTAKDLRVPETSKQIAKRMRELHDGIELLEEERDAGPFVWRNWDKWVKRAGEVVTHLDRQILDHEASSKRSSHTHVDAWKKTGLLCGVEWPVFRRAVETYRKWLDEQYGGPAAIRDKLVFAHNDVSLVTA
jgi:choline kinase